LTGESPESRQNKHYKEIFVAEMELKNPEKAKIIQEARTFASKVENGWHEFWEWLGRVNYDPNCKEAAVFAFAKEASKEVENVEKCKSNELSVLCECKGSFDDVAAGLRPNFLAAKTKIETHLNEMGERCAKAADKESLLEQRMADACSKAKQQAIEWGSHPSTWRDALTVYMAEQGWNDMRDDCEARKIFHVEQSEQCKSLDPEETLRKYLGQNWSGKILEENEASALTAIAKKLITQDCHNNMKNHPHWIAIPSGTGDVVPDGNDKFVVYYYGDDSYGGCPELLNFIQECDPDKKLGLYALFSTKNQELGEKIETCKKWENSDCKDEFKNQIAAFPTCSPAVVADAKAMGKAPEYWKDFPIWKQEKHLTGFCDREVTELFTKAQNECSAPPQKVLEVLSITSEKDVGDAYVDGKITSDWIEKLKKAVAERATLEVQEYVASVQADGKPLQEEVVQQEGGCGYTSWKDLLAACGMNDLADNPVLTKALPTCEEWQNSPACQTKFADQLDLLG